MLNVSADEMRKSCPCRLAGVQAGSHSSQLMGMP